MSTHALLTPAELREAELQADMAERGRRLSAFKAETQDRQWVYDAKSGQWTLERIFDGSTLLPELIAA